jgi:hypothetical protein
MQNKRLSFVTWMLGAALIGCGGAEPVAEPTEPTAAESTTGSEEEPIAEAPIEEEAAAEPAPPASGPAQLTVITKVGNDVVAAHVKVLAADHSVVAEGEAGTALTVQSGSLTIEASITDAAIMIDTPTTRHEVEVAPGATLSETVQFPRARVKFAVSLNGKADARATVSLLRNGAVVATIPASTPDFITVTPGRYTALVKSRNAEITVPEMVISEDSTRTVPLNVTL